MVGRRSRTPFRRDPLGGPGVAAVWAVVRRPGLWCEAIRQLRTVISADYRGFRALTAYGDPDESPAAGDVVAWLRWARSHRRLAARGTPGSGGGGARL